MQCSHPATMRLQSEDNDHFLNGAFCGLLMSGEEFQRKSQSEECQKRAPASTQAQSRHASSKPNAGESHRCVRCGAPAGEAASFDHICPKCGVMVCHECADDCRLIISSYRCPRCGDERSNQILLERTAWQRKMYRSAKTMYRSVSESWQALFTGGAPSSSHAEADGTGFGHARSEHQRPHGQPPPSSQTGAQPQRRQAPQAPARPEVAGPDHKTRLPVGWAEGAGLFKRANPQGQVAPRDMFHTQVPRQ